MRARRVLAVVGGLVLIGICGLNWLLIDANRTLLQRLDAARGQKDFTVGEVLPPFSGVGLDAMRTEVQLANDSRRTLLLVVSTVCPACQANHEPLRVLAAELDPQEWQVVWLSRDPWSLTRGYFDLHPVAGTVLAEPSFGSYLRLGMRTVPRSFVLAPGGGVELAITGRLGDEQLQDLAGAVGLEERLDLLAAAAAPSGSS